MTTTRTTPATPATPAKLRDGSWGARTRAEVSPGALIAITTRSGRSWTATVERVIWSGSGIWICTTESAGRPRARRRSCVTGGNCSSFGGGHSCGGHDCDGH